MGSPVRIGKYAVLEVERRFLLRTLPAELIGRTPDRRVVDRYVRHAHLRLRRVDTPDGRTTYKLGKKVRGPGQSSREATITSIELTEREHHLLCGLNGQEVAKFRYLYPHGGHTFAVDQFLGALDGLILAEVEAPTREAVDAIAVPPFAVCEVTDDLRFTGGALAQLTRADVRDLLARTFR